MVKHLPARQKTWVQPLGQEDPLEKEMAPHSSTLAWKIPWTEEPGRQQSMGSQRVGHNRATSLFQRIQANRGAGFGLKKILIISLDLWAKEIKDIFTEKVAHDLGSWLQSLNFFGKDVRDLFHHLRNLFLTFKSHKYIVI